MSNIVIVPKINLLPYRAEKKKRIAVRFGALCGFSAMLGVGIIILVHMFFAMLQGEQLERNAEIEAANAVLEKEISEIKQLKEEIAATITRKNIVENLQANRARAVLLINFLANPPEGVFFNSISTKGGILTLAGNAQSNATVAAYLKRMEAIEIINSPKLVETTADKSGKKNMNFLITAKIVDLASVKKAKDKK